MYKLFLGLCAIMIISSVSSADTCDCDTPSKSRDTLYFTLDSARFYNGGTIAEIRVRHPLSRLMYQSAVETVVTDYCGATIVRDSSFTVYGESDGCRYYTILRIDLVNMAGIYFFSRDGGRTQVCKRHIEFIKKQGKVWRLPIERG